MRESSADEAGEAAEKVRIDGARNAEQVAVLEPSVGGAAVGLPHGGGKVEDTARVAVGGKEEVDA